jgi:hypothetical protein
MNQPDDGPMAKSLAEAMIENVEDLGSLIETGPIFLCSKTAANRNTTLRDKSTTFCIAEFYGKGGCRSLDVGVAFRTIQKNGSKDLVSGTII